jgi:regulator of nucleoside diphosphate kinase
MTLRHDSRVILSRADFERLSAIVASRQAAETWPALAEELSRAEIVEAGERPGAAVAMDSCVEYVDEATGQARRVVLVFPGQEDIETGRISVVTPVGTALIGLCVGDTAEWQTRSGAWKRLRIVRVEPAARPDEPGAPGAR